jgi:hypothetical protein
MAMGCCDGTIDVDKDWKTFQTPLGDSIDKQFDNHSARQQSGVGSVPVGGSWSVPLGIKTKQMG